MNKYHYTNLYKHIAETGYRIDGTPASDIEKAVAPYVSRIAPIQDVTTAVAGRHVAQYNSSVPTGNGKQWGAESGKKLNLNGTGSPYGPQPDNGPLKPLRPYGPQQYSGSLQPLSTLDNLSPRQISNMSLESIQRALPKGWELKNNKWFCTHL